MRDSRWAGIAGATAGAAFLPALSGGFVYDDHGFYSGNPALTKTSILWRAFTDLSVQRDNGIDPGLWRPLRTLSFALDRAAFGLGTVGPHAVNVVVHAVSTALLFVLLRRFGVGVVAALSGALLFALHPAQAECVAWLSCRGDLLAMALILAAIVLDLADRRVAALVAGCAALLCKEQAIVWPALAWTASLLAGRDAKTATRRVLVPAVAVGAFLALRWAVGVVNTQEGGQEQGRAGLALIASMLGHQTWYALFPIGTLFDWQLPPLVHPAAASLVAAGAAACVAWKPTRLPSLWFLAALGPTLFVQAVVPLNILVCDRWLLFALPALGILAAQAVERVGPAPAVVGALCFVALTETEIPVWKSEVTLWTRTADRMPGHPRANHWLGTEALQRGDFEEAVRRLRVPDTTKGRFHLACALDAFGQTRGDADAMREAAARYDEARRLYDLDARAEGKAGLQPLALLGGVSATLVYGEITRDFGPGADRVRALLASPRPAVTADAAQGWELRIEAIARSAEKSPLLGAEWARHVREWGRLR